MKFVKIFTVLFLSTASLFGCGSGSPGNVPGGNGGKDKYYYEDIGLADPFILNYKGKYYAYGTSSDNGFEVYYSDSLSMWDKYNSFCLSKADSYGTKWFWAPEVYYVDKYKKFYMFYTAEEHVCVATSDSPLGPFVQDNKVPIMNESCIDPDVWFDSDGTPYLYFVRFNNGNCIWVAQLTDDLKSIKTETLTECMEATEPWELSMGKVVEGPSVVKRRDTYYLFYSANDYRSQNYGVGYATSKSPYGPWKKYSGNPILQKPSLSVVGTGHGGLFQDKDGAWKYVFHAHYSPASVQPRQLYLSDVVFNNDGTVKMPYNSIIQLKYRIKAGSN